MRAQPTHTTGSALWQSKPGSFSFLPTPLPDPAWQAVHTVPVCSVTKHPLPQVRAGALASLMRPPPPLPLPLPLRPSLRSSAQWPKCLSKLSSFSQSPGRSLPWLRPLPSLSLLPGLPASGLPYPSYKAVKNSLDSPPVSSGQEPKLLNVAHKASLYVASAHLLASHSMFQAH